MHWNHHLCLTFFWFFLVFQVLASFDLSFKEVKILHFQLSFFILLLVLKMVKVVELVILLNLELSLLDFNYSYLDEHSDFNNFINAEVFIIFKTHHQVPFMEVRLDIHDQILNIMIITHQEVILVLEKYDAQHFIHPFNYEQVISPAKKDFLLIMIEKSLANEDDDGEVFVHWLVINLHMEEATLKKKNDEAEVEQKKEGLFHEFLEMEAFHVMEVVHETFASSYLEVQAYQKKSAYVQEASLEFHLLHDLVNHITLNEIFKVVILKYQDLEDISEKTILEASIYYSSYVSFEQAPIYHFQKTYHPYFLITIAIPFLPHQVEEYYS